MDISPPGPSVVRADAPPRPPEGPEVSLNLGYSNRILILISAPLLRRDSSDQRDVLKSVPPLAVQEEIDAILAALEKIQPPVSLQIDVAVATVESLGYILSSSSPPLIIHFTGHGVQLDQDTALVLEDEAGLARPLTADELRTRLNPLRRPPCELAVLNACHSQGLSDVLLDKGVRHVVAVDAEETILDSVSRCFAKHFYAPLLSGRWVSEAYAHAHDAVLVDDDLLSIVDENTYESVTWDEASKFRLLPENSVEHDTKLAQENTSGTIVPPTWENTNLPALSPHPFVGRRKDLHRVASQLKKTLSNVHSPRCLLLHGMGGMGKTALAQAAGRWQHERARFAKGVWFVDFRNLTEISQARNRIGSTLGLPQATQQSNDTLASALKDWHALLILDDLDILFEAQLNDMVDLLNSLLGCPRLRLAVTARRALPGSVIYHRHDVERMEPQDARVAFKNYALKNSYQEEDMRWLMNFLDGYPFPIRLAASYARMADCSLRDLRQRLEAKPVSMLIYPGEPEDRNTSLAKTLDLSYDHLPDGPRRIFPLLALFPAGLTEDAARFIWGEEAGVQALERLVQFSMAEEPEQPISHRRFDLPEPARRYAERHQRPDAMQHTGPKVLDFFYKSVSHAAALLTDEQYGHQSRSLLTLEQPNLDRFLDWGYEYERSCDGICRSARITALLSDYWISFANSPSDTVISRLELALEAADRNNDRLGQAHVHKATGDVRQHEQEIDLALSSYTVALDLFKAVKSQLSEAQVHTAIGNLRRSLGDKDLAISSYKDAVRLFAQAQSPLEAARAQEAIADIRKSNQEELNKEELDIVISDYKEALFYYELAASKRGAAAIHKKMGDVYRAHQALDLAVSSYKTAVSLFRSLPNWLKAGQAQEAIADIELHYTGLDTAMTSYAKALSLYRDWNSLSDAARVQNKIADAQRDSKVADPDVVITNYREALTLYERVEMWLQAAEVQKTIGDIQLSLGNQGLAALSYKGAANTYEVRLHRQVDAGHLHEQIGDIRVSISTELAIQNYRKALALYASVGKTSEHRRVQRKIWDIE
jgi:tetratricopeptide (TPR) repeat protein